jgi:hypothetical protein
MLSKENDDNNKSNDYGIAYLFMTTDDLSTTPTERGGGGEERFSSKRLKHTQKEMLWEGF